jgi:hypothetical protein
MDHVRQQDDVRLIRERGRLPTLDGRQENLG